MNDDTMKNYVQSTETQIKQWGAKIADSPAKSGAESGKRTVDLNAKLQMVQSKLEELKAASQEKWEGFKAGVEKSLKDLDTAFQAPVK